MRYDVGNLGPGMGQSQKCTFVIEKNNRQTIHFQLIFSDETVFSAKVTGLTRYIPVYGIPDVKEVLHLISTTRAATLSETRPLKILNYLQVDQ